MFRDTVGNIKPNKMFNIWRFSKDSSSYRLVSDTTIEFKDKKLINTYKKIKDIGIGIGNLFVIRQIGDVVDDEVRKLNLDKEYDAWTIANISVYKDEISVFIDLFKKDRWYHKLLYLIHKTCVIDNGNQ